MFFLLGVITQPLPTKWKLHQFPKKTPKNNAICQLRASPRIQGRCPLVGRGVHRSTLARIEWLWALHDLQDRGWPGEGRKAHNHTRKQCRALWCFSGSFFRGRGRPQASRARLSMRASKNPRKSSKEKNAPREYIITIAIRQYKEAKANNGLSYRRYMWLTTDKFCCL